MNEVWIVEQCDQIFYGIYSKKLKPNLMLSSVRTEMLQKAFTATI
jgi:hypothetical protein